MSDAPKKDLSQIGISPGGQRQIDFMKDNRIIDSDLDGYLLGVATAIAFMRDPFPKGRDRPQFKTKYAINSVDPQQSLRTIIVEVYPSWRKFPYRAIEDLADQGLEILESHNEGDELWLGELVSRLQEANRLD